MLKTSSAEMDILLREVIARGNNLQSRARGRSMYPFVHENDILIIESRDAAELNPGDIALFRTKLGTYVTHRVIKKTGPDTIVTKGDNSRRYDVPISAESVIGRVIQIEGSGRRLKLTGFPSRLYAYLIAQLARVHFRGQVRVTRLLGRLWWLIGGRRIT